MRVSLVFASLILIVAVGGCRTLPLDSGGEPGGGGAAGSGGGHGGAGGSGSGGGSHGGGGGGGGVDFDMAPYVDPDLAIPIDFGLPYTPPCGRANPRPVGSDALTLLRWGMAADWLAIATTPWTAPYRVAFEFSPDPLSNSTDGMYSAVTDDGSSNLPFYYDQNPEHGNYHIKNVNSDGSGSGAIYLIWSTSPDQLENIYVNGDGTILTFDYFHAGYGPVHYVCQCHN